MKAILVKSDDFKTIGFEVTSNGVRVFNYGISPQSGNYTKEININDWMIQIIDLIKLQATINEQRHFIHNFFEIATKQGIVKDGQPVKFIESDERLTQNERKLKNIIDNII